ncbi:acetyl-CoA carboxylase, carboxyltransferase subunit beta [Paenibacillus apiarius]|uniref:Acetyl-coenzyme A carboxylase carboxyl transferase subunit beta n=1 Tax=Paenibacillus apiarius TaxID=46240 RepID=A0ABT4DWP6_9BACL|nr:acetyl-CoA carboxylase, carboxyltransferase subunit beta [Paenibacillus apiarius]MBN3522915.1 acetyl-CoA carboxylase carboxyltransferase subunit beta [Paenibacillus apiarius]MCY9515321.1 acetyl-CoA carboxylase, carboxyltransferase subunit beta [Paenibacillus apiarius]MCY9521777.1 acetyl-CoA carboxylase, carboxyltransferase subunit beta [Paenibacillus apiarius]MCY9550170.1 acetyl-CoA carboxylase, carboxyltransferase subunit beta [Paenibacillus apiarius]MCY9559446.1 acetyl-CoA carboxylase, ca
MFKDLFQKKKYATVPSASVHDDRPKREIPEGLMNKCPKCGTIQYHKELEKNLKVCSHCGHHLRLNALERIEMTLDEGRFFEYDTDIVSEDPLGFPDYMKKLKQQQAKSGLDEAVITGEGTIGGFPVVVAVMSFNFFTGSMGSVVGEKITRAIETAMQKQYPLIIFSTSGGARMQESILSLMQMAKTSAALAKLHEAGGLYISVFTDPTTGGVSASFGMLGDINLAEPGALVGFAGRIVIEQTIRQKLPDEFQTAEFNMKHGQIDLVVPRKDMRQTLIKLIELHTVKGDVTHGG